MKNIKKRRFDTPLLRPAVRKPVAFLPEIAFYAALLSPYYLKHVIRVPFRKTIPEIMYKYRGKTYSRYRLALFDSFFDVIISAYQELSQQNINPQTGQFFFLLLELTKSLDEYLERQDTIITEFSTQAVLTDKKVKEDLDNLICFCNYYNKSAEELQNFFTVQFNKYFEEYLSLISEGNRSGTAFNFDHLWRIVQIDNGIWMQSVAQLLAIFNGHECSEVVKKQFFYFGLVGKFIDDLVDLKRDVSSGRVNLLSALVFEYYGEEALTSIKHSKCSMSHNWFLTNYSAAYKQYLLHMNRYFNNLQSSKLRMASNMLMIPVILGFDYDSSR